MQFPTDPQILSALIQSTGGIVSALIASVCAALIGKRFADRKRLQQQLVIAMKDIMFMLEVERNYVQQDGSCGSCKNDMRDQARRNGYEWSGQFVESKAKTVIDRNN